MSTSSTDAQVFRFRFTPLYRAAASLFGVTPANSRVTIAGRQLEARYGPWVLTTLLENVEGTEITGPFSVPKTIGPAHLSLADRGLTFSTNPDRGLCIRFRTPVPGIEPTGRLRHPGLTVTVEDVVALQEALGR